MRPLSKSAIVLTAALLSLPAFAQYGTTWPTAADIKEGVSGTIVGTATDLDEGQNRLTLSPDQDRYGQVTVTTDSVSTQYNGFGDVINGKPEIFTGGKGFANVRTGDRLEIRGIGRSSGVLRADFITLLGRPVPAPQTGVGETRSPSAGVSTPAIGNTATVYARVEGVVQQVNASDNLVVVQTDSREMLTIRTSRDTPVYYQGDKYQVSNLEVGDRIRVEPQGTASSDREIRARSIQVIQSVQEGGGTPRVSTVSGRVTRIDRTADVARIDTGRGDVRVDMSHAYDPNGRRVRAADLQIGDRVEIAGNYGASSDIFAASTVRFNDDVFSNPPAGGNEPGTPSYGGAPGLVTVAGTVSETLQDTGSLIIRERATGRLITLYVADDFVVKTRSGYTTADHLDANASVLVKAYRDADGNYIAQTIRLR